MAPEVILVVDDNPLNLKLMRFLLVKRGYEVDVANDAEQALEVLGRRHPRLILMDIQMPGIDGLELTRRLKADAKSSAIPIIAVTAFAMKGDEERALEAGCEAYVTKPIDTHTLPALVRSVLNRASIAPPP